MLRTMAGLCLWALCACALAQSAIDPTRPPPQAMPAAPGAAIVVAVPVGPVLQALKFSYGFPQRRSAVIDGVTVAVGDKVGAAVVERIGNDDVVLREGRERRTLKLYPDLAVKNK